MAQVVILRGLEQQALACSLIRRAPVDAVVTIKEGTRTLDQNALMWAALSDIARAKPEGRVMGPEAWKAAFMSALGYEIVWQPGIDGSPP
ncbi:MAG: recombination protein NinB, partial [Roseinatronobacter sp.]